MENISVKQFIIKDFHTSEAIKALRTNLLFSGEGIHVIALTSFNAREGKSTASFQLAASLAQAGKRVLLLDADLRKSVLANRLRVHGKVNGLSHYLSGMANVSDLLYETDLPGLYVMFAGVRIATPAEVLGSNQFHKLIPALRDVFDYVIIDTPPLGQVIDCAVIAPETDGILMVIDSNNNSYKLERRVKQQLEKAGGKILGVVLNRVDMKSWRSYYGKKHDYRCGYGYGESEGEKK